MNDPGLGDEIQSAANDVENGSGNGSSDISNPDRAHALFNPSRWWFASTAFPLLAGTFGPVASAFNIIALAFKWRISILPGTTQSNGQPVEDPQWLIGVNAVSLALALIANGALLLNMARRLKFSIAQPITIIGWYLSGSILIGLVIAASTDVFELPGDWALSQAYYYAIMSAVLYIIVSSLMMITVYGAYSGKYPKEFRLTMSQRTLMMQTIAYLVYLLGGGAVFAHLESWNFPDGVYWANTTLLTIGLGDFYPVTHAAQSLLFPFAIGGIIILGLVIGSIRSLVLDRGKKKLAARMEEKKREQIVEKLYEKDETAQMHLFSPTMQIDNDAPEQEKRRRQFEYMRHVQKYTAAKRKWTSLGISALAWLSLWLIGAVVFWKAESYAQGWGYFEGIYFAYVALMTIGYGDFTPVTNAGKAFFVLWSLLAVPTLTILISNMGDTVITFIQGVTNWFGELTVLPERAPKIVLKQGIDKVARGHLFEQGEKPSEEPSAGVRLAGKGKDPDKREGDPEQARGAATALDRIGDKLEADELEEAREALRNGDTLEKDRHLYHYLLIKEIQNVMRDLIADPHKKYGYEQWSWYFRLMGEDEGEEKYHQDAPSITPNMKSDTEYINPVEGKSSVEERRWNWLGVRSPLLGNTNEPEWLLERLSLSLEKAIKKERRARRGEGGSQLRLRRGRSGQPAALEQPGMKEEVERRVPLSA